MDRGHSLISDSYFSTSSQEEAMGDKSPKNKEKKKKKKTPAVPITSSVITPKK
jgi:hypothetical protein